MKRIVEPELLDDLAPEDLLALGSRRDLRRVNAWMGNARAMERVLRIAFRDPPNRLVELGAGDGHFLYQVADGLGESWRGTRAVLLDRRPAVSPDTLQRFAGLVWRVETVTSDVFDWLRQPPPQEHDVLVANLFLHHFSAPRLAELCNLAARRARMLVAIEPRRSTWALVFSHLVGVIGCNRVTRHDAPVSVRAGFHGGELSQSWSGDGEWSLEERAVGLFSHLFIARRTGRIPGPDTAAATQRDRSPSDRSGRARSLYTQRRKSSRRVWGPGLQFPVGRVPSRGGTSVAVYSAPE